MFNGIAADYDLLNHMLSAGIDNCWRRKAVREVFSGKNRTDILDMATGTGDFAIALARKSPAGGRITGIDISSEMLAGCRHKIEKKGLTEKISLMHGDCENLPFDDGKFDAVTAGFGVRNFENLEKGISEMFRVLKPGGKAVILELSTPDGRLIAASVDKFPRPEKFCGIMRECGFCNVSAKALTFGICRMYVGEKL